MSRAAAQDPLQDISNILPEESIAPTVQPILTIAALHDKLQALGSLNGTCNLVVCLYNWYYVIRLDTLLY